MKVELADAELVRTDHNGRPYILVGWSDCERLYEITKAYWKNRNREEIDETGRARILHDQAIAYVDRPQMRDRMAQICTDSIKTRRKFSMLELGAANGSALDVLYERFPHLLMTYTGYELLPLLVDDFHKRYPMHEIVQDEVEAFLARDEASFDKAPYSLFLASLFFMLVRPDLAHAAILKAGRLSEEILIYDYIGEDTRNIPDGRNMIMVAELFTIFIHPWEEHLDEAGFEVIDIVQETDKGMGFVHARRRT